jgi:SAM-dependent methyltransferase
MAIHAAPLRAMTSTFVTEHHRYDRMFASHTAALMRALDLCPSERVLDVGCGAGTTTIEAARRVAPHGAAIGVDRDVDAIELAKARAPHASFHCADISTFEIGEPLDAIVSRFGSIHFRDPIATYTHLRSLMRPRGRLAFACSRSFDRNEWAQIPVRAIGSLARSGGPGPFALADEARIHEILDGAGFRDIELTSLDEPVCVGLDVNDAIDFFWRSDGRALARSLEPDAIDAIERALIEGLRPHQTPNGVLLGSSSWIVTARA